MTKKTRRVPLIVLAIVAAVPSAAYAQPYTNSYWTTANYIAVLGRNPDAPGWLYWDGQLNGGMSQTQLTTDLLATSEYCGFFGQPAGCTPDNGSFLDLLYQNALGRAPDPTGYSYWMGQLANGVSYAQVVYDFIDSGPGSGTFPALYGSYCSSYLPGYATPLAYSTSASAVAEALRPRRLRLLMQARRAPAIWRPAKSRLTARTAASWSGTTRAISPRATATGSATSTPAAPSSSR